MKRVRLIVYLVSFIVLISGVFLRTCFADEHYKYPPPGRLIKVYGHMMHLYCTGSGSPVVILEAGLSSYSLDWSRVQPEIAKTTEVCSYDRAGYGWSEPGPKPRTAQEIVKELQELLTVAGVKSPYILAGQSLGGIYVQLFALEHPTETAGVVLIDSVNRDMDKKIPKKKLDRFENDLKFYIYLGKLGAPFGIPRLLHMPSSIIIPKLPKKLQPVAYSLAYKTKSYQVIYDELDALHKSEVEFDRQFPDIRYQDIKHPGIPVVVLSGAIPRDYPPFLVSTGLFDQWKKLQVDLAQSIPGAKQIIARKSGHFIQLDQPGLVIDTIDTMVKQVRH
ncbi:MAG: alpha/beta hydrolase [Deltaproteobacteria bacterium]|nr:alpha/beta hydrolase [Deltaproteobacteria bacterium]MCL5878223.1 alpha/beta hydrolase [Deltaproteobacteria bacterium]